MTSFIIVPGWQNSGPAHWQSLWQTDLQGARIEAASWEEPDPQDWIAALDRAVAACDGPPVLIGHSLGCITIAKWAMQASRSARAAFLAAPSDVDREGCPEILAAFGPIPMSRLPFPCRVVATLDDPWLNPMRAKVFAAAWGAAFTLMPSGAHISATSGYGPWPEGRRMLAQLID